MKQPPKQIDGSRPYDTDCWFWALTYQATKQCKPHIVCLYPRGNDARREALRINQEQFWKDANQRWGALWGVKRFRFYFRGAVIDAYEHSFERIEKKRV